MVIYTPGFKDFVQKISPEIPPSHLPAQDIPLHTTTETHTHNNNEGYEILHVPLVRPYLRVLFTYVRWF